MLGYGHVAVNVIKALQENGHKPSLLPMGAPTLTIDFPDLNLVASREPRKGDDCLTIWHEYALIENAIGKGNYIGYPFFELNELDPNRKRNLNYMDKLVVASDWAKGVLLNNGIKIPIIVAPPGISDIFSPQSVPKAPNGPYVFFNVGKYEYRKSTRLIAELFDKAFERTDNVELWLHCDSDLKNIKMQLKEFHEFCANLKNGNKIKFTKPVKTDIALAQLMNESDCGVFLSRAEGFGLPILQMIACGKPVISTDYSGHSQFLTPTNHFNVPVTKFESARDNIWFNGLGTWAAIDKNLQDLTIDYMRQCYLNRPAGNSGSVQEFTWNQTANSIMK